LSHLAARLHVVQGWGVPAWYVVIAAQVDRPLDYGVRDVARVLGPRVLGPLPYDTTAARVLDGRGQTRSGIGRSKLGQAGSGVAASLATLAGGAVLDPAAPATPAIPAAQPAYSDARTAWPRTRMGAP